MANALYDSFINQQFTLGSADVDLDDNSTTTIKVALVNSSYNFDASHDFFNDISSFVVGTPVALTSRTFSGRKFSGGNVTFTAVAGGSTVKAIVIYKEVSGSPTTSPLIAYIDQATGLTVVTNGGDITVAWDATNGIFKF